MHFRFEPANLIYELNKVKKNIPPSYFSNSMVDLALLLLNVAFVIPKLMISFYEKRAYVIILIPLTIATVFYRLQVSEAFDLYRHFERYDIYRMTGVSIVSKGYLMDFLYFTGNKLNLNRHFLSFVSAYIIYYYLLKIYYEISEVNNFKSSTHFYFGCFYLLSIPLLLFSGIRFGVAMMLCLYGTYCIFVLKDKKGWIYLLFAVLSHISMLLIALLCIFNLIVNIKSRVLLFFLFIASLSLGLFPSILNQLLERVSNIINVFTGIAYIDPSVYIYGSYGLDGGSHLNATGKLSYHFLRYMMLGIMISYFLCTLRAKQTDLKRIIYLLMFFCFIVFSYSTFFGRYSLVVMMMILFESTKNAVLSNKLNKSNFIFGLLIIYVLLNRLIDLNSYYPLLIDSYSNFLKVSGVSVLYDVLEHH